jgi:hypothetical protein
MPKTQAAQKDEDEFGRRFQEALSAANRQSPLPGAVQRFKEVLDVCRAEGVTPWRDMKTPLRAALEIVLMKEAEPMVRGGITAVWGEQARDLRDSLGYEQAPALERMLIEHASLCWLRLAVMEVRYSAVVAANNTLTQVEHTERRLTEAQKRFNRACESLARVRKLSRPSVQINVATEGGRQLNVA